MKMKTEATETFGPFIVPAGGIKSTNVTCPQCKHLVMRIGQSVPGLVPRIMAYACQCGGAVITWEDERQPTTTKMWKNSLSLMKKNNVDLVIFNGNKRTPPSFSGIN
jgi:hypothetical protein